MSDKFYEISDFKSIVGDTFTLPFDLDSSDEKEDVHLTLAECEASPVAEYPERKRDPFFLVFHGPKEFILNQRIYDLKHKKLGTCSIFLVAIGQKEDVTIYEAVFN